MEYQSMNKTIYKCDYKNCNKDGEVYIGDVVDYVTTWLSKREPKPKFKIFMCEKHARKFYKIMGTPYKDKEL